MKVMISIRNPFYIYVQLYLPRDPLLMRRAVFISVYFITVYPDQDIRCSVSAGDQYHDIFRRCIYVIPKLLTEGPVRSPGYIKAVSKDHIGCRKCDLLILTVAYVRTMGYALPGANLIGSILIYSEYFSCI